MCSDEIPPKIKCEDLYPWADTKWAKKHAKDLEDYIRDEIEKEIESDIIQFYHDTKFIEMNQE